MQTVLVWIEGHTSMLQHRATEENLSGKTRGNGVEADDDPRNICNRAIYRMPNSQTIAVPGSAISRMLREAGGAHKAKGSRKSLKYLLPAAVLVLDELCPLHLIDRRTPITDFEVDSRPVTIPATKGRVMRHRARFNEWAIPVNMSINEELIDPALVRKILGEGAQRIGLGDFRPERGGPFGTGMIVSWDVHGSLPRTAARERNSQAA